MLPKFTLETLMASSEERAKLKESLLNLGAIDLHVESFAWDLVEKINKVTLSFFQKEENYKNQYRLKEPPIRGYVGVGEENLAQALGTGDIPDLCMKYSWARENNIFPHKEFKEIWEAYFNALYYIARQMTQVICEVFALVPDEEGKKHLYDGEGCLRYLYYPKVSQKTQKLAMEEHSDLGLLTLSPGISEENSFSYEIAGEEGYVQPIPQKNFFTLILGDSFQHISSGLLKAVRHRVVQNRADQERKSIAFFYLPQPELNLTLNQGSSFGGLYKKGMKFFGELMDEDFASYIKPSGR